MKKPNYPSCLAWIKQPGVQYNTYLSENEKGKENSPSNCSNIFYINVLCCILLYQLYQVPVYGFLCIQSSQITLTVCEEIIYSMLLWNKAGYKCLDKKDWLSEREVEWEQTKWMKCVWERRYPGMSKFAHGTKIKWPQQDKTKEEKYEPNSRKERKKPRWTHQNIRQLKGMHPRRFVHLTI